MFRSAVARNIRLFSSYKEKSNINMKNVYYVSMFVSSFVYYSTHSKHEFYPIVYLSLVFPVAAPLYIIHVLKKI